MKCIQCGAELPEGAKFCVFCGENQESRNEHEGTDQKTRPTTCWQCGEELPEEAKFCFFCGKSQENPAANEATAQEVWPKVCWQCGAELPEEAAFCGFCGAERKASGSVVQVPAFKKPTRQNMPNEQSSIFSEGAAYWHSFFSKDPTSGITGASRSRSLFWVLAAVANALLFSLAMCNNIPQLVNHGFESFIKAVLQCVKELVPDGREIISSIGNYVPDMDLSAIYSQFVPFTLVSLAVFAVEAIVVYIMLYTLKRQLKSVSSLLNVVSVSLFPITAVSVLNLLLGLLCPPITICTLVAAAFIHIVFLYEGIKKLTGAEASPLWQIGLTVLVICAVLMVAMWTAFTNALGDFISAVASDAIDLADSVLSGVLSYLFDILEGVMYW